ncbi:class I SAM-dependent methyltransferase [Catenuloplanes atrovinosus]|uniref:SAM-dependent methyltransferase n=1 Tax=Catenuloplanes atrovinosus TaxID=137266 RepID=A0AAE4C9H4_9ACTN|nr:class I SAM-dependent methyltransferase [Catenuloplanes atrovinosus]MDR7276058.1 SAM-dependent methyltransferase [Catenuloplanes atrovinosus]
MSATSAEYTDPRTVALYDALHPDPPEHPFYVDVAAQLPAVSVADVGCGTGRLAAELARRGHRVTAVDPSRTMLDLARRRPIGALVSWRLGDARVLPENAFELVVLAGGVVAEITDDRELIATFAAVRRALRPGGRLAFDARRFTARDWTGWTRAGSYRRLANGAAVWREDARVLGDRVRYLAGYRLADGTELTFEREIRLRSDVWYATVLAEAGFRVDPVDDDAPGLVVMATAGPPRRASGLCFERVAGRLWAVVDDDSGRPARVPMPDDSLEIIARLRLMGVALDQVVAAAAAAGLDWDPAGEVRARSEADMDEWRRRDREERERRKRAFRDRMAP